MLHILLMYPIQQRECQQTIFELLSIQCLNHNAPVLGSTRNGNWALPLI